MSESIKQDMYKQLNLTLMQKKKHLILYQSFPLKRQIYSAVRSGDLESIKKINQEYSLYVKKLYEQNRKQDALFYQVYYEYFCTVIELSYIAGECGLNQVVSEDIRDEYLVKVLSCSALFRLVALFQEMLIEFTTLVKLSNISYQLPKEMRGMIQYIENHLDDHIALEEVAEAAGFSYYYASALFKKHMGITMSQYIQREKIGLAKKYLTMDKLSIHETSQKLQFCSQSYFSKVFKRIVGVSPKEFLNQNKDV